MNNRRFGIELEMLSPSFTMREVAAKISEAGIPCVEESYGHSTPSHWKIVTDASLSSGGMELVSPILFGEVGLSQVETICGVLAANGIVIDKSCGFHVHVNARDLSGPTLANVMVRYARHEMLIDGFMPPSRRGSNNRHCKSVAHLSEDFETVTMRNPTHVANMQRDRYYKLNLSAFTRHGTIEFRQHSGTIAYEKIKNWVLFCLNFVETSCEVATTVPASGAIPGMVAGPMPTTREERRFAKLSEALAPANCYDYAITNQNIATAMGITVSSVPGYISRFRDAYPHIPIKNRRGFGYFHQATTSVVASLFGTTPSTVVYTIPADNGAMAGLDEVVREFFELRARMMQASTMRRRRS